MAIPILVVDDEPDMRDLIRIRMRREIRKGKYNFEFAVDGQQALEMLQADDAVQLILCDINMPKMNGIELLAQLKKLDRDVKIVMVTAYGNMENIRAAMNEGAYDFINKPIDFQDLKKTIDKADAELQRLRAVQAESAQLKAIDQLKNRYFTHISHEFRTPLTIIDGMASQIHEKPEEWALKGSEMINRNTRRLIQLVNEILDLRKLKHGKLNVHWYQGNIVAFIKQIIQDVLQPFAVRQGIHLSLASESNEIFMDFDPGKLQSIVLNLVSNAIKYTPSGGTVEVKVGREELINSLTLSVSDTGVGISPDDLPHIFDRFYQVDESKVYSSGIGLTLCKELAQLLGGDISVKSVVNQGSIFQLHLPIHQDAPIATEIPVVQTFSLEDPDELETQLEQLNEAENDQSRLLIVEDNADIVQYLKSFLAGKYQLLVARNGEEGIALALKHMPDIIISDVMMPVKDGFELTQTLKADPRTDHIPIILLTARADVEARIEGLAYGADAYLAKPFERQELMVRLEQLIAFRKKMQEKFHLQKPDDAGKVEKKLPVFIEKCKQIIQEHLDDAEFSVPDLAEQLGLSRSQLYRKIKALTNLSTSMFIQHIKLDKADELLRQSDLNVSEIAYMTGFATPNYFSNLYKEKYGIAPRERRAS